MIGITVDENTNTITLDGSAVAKARLRYFDTKKNKAYWEGKWDWETHPQANASIVIENTTIDEHFDAGCVMWFLTAREYKKITFKRSCAWTNKSKSRAILERTIRNSTREVVIE